MMMMTTAGQQKRRLFPSYRLAISVLSFCGMLLSAQSQSSMGAAMVCMVTCNGSDHNNTATRVSSALMVALGMGIRRVDTFDWDKPTQGWIHSSRFLGYYLAQLPSGFLTTYMTGKDMVTIGLVVMGTFDVITVLCAGQSFGLLIFVRFVQGVGNAFASTGCYDIVGKWVLSQESSLLAGLPGAGFYAGAFLGFVFPALVCDSPVLGWPYIFYVSGGLSLLFVAVWLAFADNSPESSRWASQEEKNFIMACKQDDMGKGKVRWSHTTSGPVWTRVAVLQIPWTAMARSGPLYAVAIAQTSGDVVIYLSFTVAPAFFTDVLHTSRGYADFVCGIPFILTVPWTILFGRSLDVLRQRDLISTSGARRLAQGIGNLGPAICYLLLTLMPSPSSHVGGAVVVYLLSLMAMSCVTSGWIANMSDLAPKFVGAVCTMSQSLALWTAFVVPVFVDNLTVHKTREQWNIVFYIIAGLQVVCFVGYYILSSGEIQPWANVREKSRPVTEYTLVPMEDDSD
ncbi:vesicular glutamate transporter 1-like [Babylonia areolata]|uniref:vesicular glutamate transporter 1-like n=1 Tax=Babylonia areolata TaxID=304850 RepID=UPI003FCF7992